MQRKPRQAKFKSQSFSRGIEYPVIRKQQLLKFGGNHLFYHFLHQIAKTSNSCQYGRYCFFCMSINIWYIKGCGLSFFTLRLIPCFLPFFDDFQIRVLIQDLISRLIVNKNRITIYQNLSLGVDDQKQLKVRKLKMLLLFDGSLNILEFFTHPEH